MKLGADYIKNSFWLLICRDCTGIYTMDLGPIPANFASNFPMWDDPRPGTSTRSSRSPAGTRRASATSRSPSIGTSSPAGSRTTGR